MDQVSASLEEYSVRLNNLSLASLALNRHNASQHPPIIALHGWLDNAASFVPLFSALNPDCACYLLDWPGHGHSDHLPVAAQYHFVDWVEWLHRFIEFHQFEKVILVGHSMGAIIGSLYAAAFPEKVERLVMIDGVGPIAFAADSMVDHVRKAIVARVKPSPAQRPIYPTFSDAVQARLRAGQLSPAAAELLAERGCKAVTGGWQWCYDPRLKLPSAQRMVEEQAASIAARLTLPVLLIMAKQGFPGMVEQLASRKPLFPNLCIEEVAGNHHLHMDTPRVIAEKINDFLAFL